ncbi:DNA repair protein RecN [Eubacteriales bacterium OttesenSCG-928-N14]|nr:DNA repair protein RecN [Eubacteriales bacterium OttesenSCG-928-N14]
MLSRISIQNVALIDALAMNFGQGLNILTGETGTGKSIIIDSINLVLGVRADREMIKTGSNKAVVEATFVDHTSKVSRQLEELGIEGDADGEVVLSREIHASGRNVARINGTLVNNAALSQIGELLVDIHGQHEHQSLFDAARHIDILDRYRSELLQPALQEYRTGYAALKEVEDSLNAYGSDEGGWERQMDILRFQIGELEDAALQAGEDETLLERRKILQNAERILAALNNAHEALYLGDGSAYSAIGSAVSQLSGIASLDDTYEKAHAQANELYYLAEAVSDLLRDLKVDMSFEPGELEEVEQRIDYIAGLKRKYGGSIDAALAFLEDAKTKLDDLEHAAETIAALAEKRQTCMEGLYATAKRLSALRQEVAEQFAGCVMQQFTDLGMKHAVFSVQFAPLPQLEDLLDGRKHFGQDGLDAVEFMISTNPGEPLKPLRRIISGGEASRIMLALKNVSADLDDIGCLIFDEIDTGISGNMAHVVAQKMAAISRNRQVICVTHLAQLAAMGDVHYVIEKHTDGITTHTTVQSLDFEGHIDELVRLLGGSGESVHGKGHAQDLDKQAKAYKQLL